jgi:amino acid transporter
LVIVLFSLVHLSIISVIPWREALVSRDNLTAEFMTRIHGSWAATAVTVCLVGSCFVSAFSGTLGYSRVPFAAARNGHFFRWFDDVHPTHRIPHRSLLLIGGLMLVSSFMSLDVMITALIATRILEQFIAQIFAVMLLRHLQPDRPKPWRMWLYPLPCAIALVGWIYVYATTGWLFILIGIGTLVAGLLVFLVWSRQVNDWPFGMNDG